MPVLITRIALNLGVGLLVAIPAVIVGRWLHVPWDLHYLAAWLFLGLIGWPYRPRQSQ